MYSKSLSSLIIICISEIKMIQTKTFAAVFLTAIALAMGATVTAIGTGIFLQHANAAVKQNQLHCNPDLSGAGCVNTPGSGPNSQQNFGGSSLNSQNNANAQQNAHLTTNPPPGSPVVVCNTNPGHPTGTCNFK
jgi:hypothetical protein